MIEQVIQQRNWNKAYQKVCANKGAGGVDGMEISQLNAHLQTHGRALVARIRSGSYQPSPIKGVEIPKSNGKRRMLGIPTLTDRVFQQALHQAGEPVFEPDFQRHSYGFRPNRNAHQATRQAQRNINEGYQHGIAIDLKACFDQLDHALLLELIHRKLTCHFVPVFKKGARGQYQRVVSAKSWKAFKRKLTELTCKTIPMRFDQRVQRLSRLIRGGLNYFKLANIHGKLQAMDSWLRKRLRQGIWSRGVGRNARNANGKT